MNGPRRTTWVLMGVVGVLVVGCVVLGGWYYLHVYPLQKVARAAAEVPGCIGVRVFYYDEIEPTPTYATLFFEDGAVFTLDEATMYDPLGKSVELETIGPWMFPSGLGPSEVLPEMVDDGGPFDAVWVHGRYREILTRIEMWANPHDARHRETVGAIWPRYTVVIHRLKSPPFPDYTQYMDFGEIPETFVLESFSASSP